MGKIIKGSTKFGQSLLARANHFEGTDLDDVYGRWSRAKADAMRSCRRLCEEMNGYNFRIISHNTFGFSVAWNYDNSETGEVMTRIETSSNTYIIDGSRRKEETDMANTCEGCKYYVVCGDATRKEPCEGREEKEE